jgi:hypothetical protein
VTKDTIKIKIFPNVAGKVRSVVGRCKARAEYFMLGRTVAVEDEEEERYLADYSDTVLFIDRCLRTKLQFYIKLSSAVPHINY